MFESLCISLFHVGSDITKNKLIFQFLLISLVSVMCFSAPIFGENTVKVTIDGVSVEFDPLPVIKDGRTLVPFRSILVALGCTVEWDPEARIAVAIKDNLQIHMPVDSTTAILYDFDPAADTISNPQEMTMDVPAAIIEGRTYVPVRFVSETLGASVNWDGETISIVTNPSNPVDVTPTAVDSTENTSVVPAQPAAKTSGVYIGSIESNKYHLPSCRYADQIIESSNAIWFDTVTEAHNHGYEACKVCDPPEQD